MGHCKLVAFAKYNNKSYIVTTKATKVLYLCTKYTYRISRRPKHHRWDNQVILP